MPFVSGFLRVRSGSGDRPDNTLPGAEGPVDPGYGIQWRLSRQLTANATTRCVATSCACTSYRHRTTQHTTRHHLAPDEPCVSRSGIAR